MKTNERLGRGQFLQSLGLSSASLMAFYCFGTSMSSCGSSKDNPTPDGNGVSGTTTGSSIDFTVDLTSSDYSKLKTAGESVIIGDVLVALTPSGTYVALSKTCTHEGNPIQYRKSQNDLYCPTHESEFALTGAVEKGPATVSLKTYTVTISGNTLTVKA